MTAILLDSIIGIIILLSIIFAFMRGFVREMLTIVTLGGAAAASYFFAPFIRPAVDRWYGVGAKVAEEGTKKAAESAKIWGVLEPSLASAFSSYIGVFFVVFLILTLAGLYVAGMIKAMGLGGVDKGLGGVFGAARGFLMVFLFYMPIAYAIDFKKYPDWAQNSVSVALLQKTYDASKEYFDDKDENGDTKVAVEKPVDPNSLTGKLKHMADELTHKKEKTGEPTIDAPSMEPANGSPVEEEPLSADERSEQRP